jgi:hypothetical protein
MAMEERRAAVLAVRKRKLKRPKYEQKNETRQWLPIND